jgi:hypothetical protein
MKNNKILLIVSILFLAVGAQAWEWFTWCASQTTGDACTTGNVGSACHQVTNPRGECDSSINPIGCTGSGNAVTLTIVDGVCGTEPTWSTPYCDGTQTTMPGTANC